MWYACFACLYDFHLYNVFAQKLRIKNCGPMKFSSKHNSGTSVYLPTAFNTHRVQLTDLSMSLGTVCVISLSVQYADVDAHCPQCE